PGGGWFKDVIFIDHGVHPALEAFLGEFHGPFSMALHGFTTLPFFLAMAGVGLAYFFYMVAPGIPATIQRTLKPLHALLENKY
ncbi:MAG: NADH-quinone oxidoreductase subunit L, partial [Rhodocyclaceae bacterium]|nr:NADH-quinone oxidoreductase subunit L [Rhodocyclaceae bacterium]